jgi:hypothetical protein
MDGGDQWTKCGALPSAPARCAIERYSRLAIRRLRKKNVKRLLQNCRPGLVLCTERRMRLHCCVQHKHTHVYKRQQKHPRVVHVLPTLELIDLSRIVRDEMIGVSIELSKGPMHVLPASRRFMSIGDSGMSGRNQVSGCSVSIVTTGRTFRSASMRRWRSFVRLQHAARSARRPFASVSVTS